MTMKKIAIMWIGILVMLSVGAFPYWYVSQRSPFGVYFSSLGRHFIFAQPEVNVGTVWIDLAPLCIEWMAISVITIGLIVTFKAKD